MEVGFAKSREALERAVSDLALARAAPDLSRWLDEGLSMGAAGERPTAAECALFARLAKNEEIPRFDEIARDFRAHAERAHVAYALSAVFVEWVVEGPGEVRLRRFVRSFEARGPEGAFSQAFGSGSMRPRSAS